VRRWRDLLARMRANPRSDWTIGDVETVCQTYGLRCTPPSGGSHYTVRAPGMAIILTIPARRPIKPIYIRNFVRFAGKKRGRTNDLPLFHQAGPAQHC
jgi:hypothetical protein